MKRNCMLVILTAVALVFFGGQPGWAAGLQESSGTGHPKVIFLIGNEDKSDAEFAFSGFTGKDEYTCRAGVDCTASTFRTVTSDKESATMTAAGSSGSTSGFTLMPHTPVSSCALLDQERKRRT